MEGEEQVLNPTPEVDAGTVVDAGKTADKAAIETLEEHKGVEITDNGEKVDNDKESKEAEKKPEEKTLEAEIKEVEDGVKEQQKAEQDVKADLETKGVDYDALVKEYEDNGKLSEESMKALKGAGYPETVVNAFIKGFEAQVNEFTNAVYKMAGGEAEYGKLCNFIKGLGEADVQAFNETINSGSLTQLAALINGYKAQMTTKYGTSNRSILGGANAVEAQGFNSKDAMIKAMNDPRYGNDMAYTEKVQRMTMQSTFLG